MVPQGTDVAKQAIDELAHIVDVSMDNEQRSGFDIAMTEIENPDSRERQIVGKLRTNSGHYYYEISSKLKLQTGNNWVVQSVNVAGQTVYERPSEFQGRWDRNEVLKYVHPNFAPIHLAAKRGNVEEIKQALKNGVPVDLRVNNTGGRRAWRKTTPLIWAAARGNSEAVRVLIDVGADIEAQNVQGVNALMAASGAIRATSGNPLDCVRMLIEAGADCNAIDQQSNSPLFYSCGAGQDFDDLPKELLPKEFQLKDPLKLLRPNIPTSIGNSYVEPVRVKRSRHGDAARLKALIDAGANVNAKSDYNNWTPLIAAATSADVSRIDLLLNAGAGIDHRAKTDSTAVMHAATSGSLAVFERLLNASRDVSGEDRDRNGRTILHRAAESSDDSKQKVRLILTHLDVDVNARTNSGYTPLTISLLRSGDAALLLLDSGADPKVNVDNVDSTILLAAKNGPAELLEKLLSIGSDPNERSKVENQLTVLMLAAGSRREPTKKVTMLLNAGANINGNSRDGTTALLLASRVGNMGAVEVLARRGADVNVVDQSDEYREDKMTPLMYVANRGADPHFMCEQTGGMSAKALIENGANVNAKNKNGQTARMLADAIKHNAVIKVIDLSSK